MPATWSALLCSLDEFFFLNSSNTGRTNSLLPPPCFASLLLHTAALNPPAFAFFSKKRERERGGGGGAGREEERDGGREREREGGGTERERERERERLRAGVFD